MFDTHCHLFEKVFEDKLDSIISSARDGGLKYFLIPAISIETSKEALKLTDIYKNVFCAVGIHPTEKLELENLNKAENTLNELCLQKKVVAIGETGLDYYHYKSSPDVQKIFLQMHIKLALKHEKALIIHNRHSTSDLIKLIETNWQETLRGKIIFHFASLEDEIIKFSEKYDCYLGIDGDITYDPIKQRQLSKIDLNKILLETDSPNVLPEPLKTQKIYPNNPSNLNITADFVSRILNINRDKMIEISTNNALRVFGIK
jgi:TatD DNase family protein